MRNVTHPKRFTFFQFVTLLPDISAPIAICRPQIITPQKQKYLSFAFSHVGYMPKSFLIMIHPIVTLLMIRKIKFQFIKYFYELCCFPFVNYFILCNVMILNFHLSLHKYFLLSHFLRIMDANCFVYSTLLHNKRKIWTLISAATFVSFKNDFKKENNQETEDIPE